MDNIEIKAKIKETIHELDNMAYGVETHHKTFPPNVYHYKRLVEQLINYLLQIKNDNRIIEITDKILSIKDNQLHELILNKDDSFEKYGVNHNMENVTRLIQLHTNILFK